MQESFFVRIPTKSLDTLKKIYLVFLVQVLAQTKDGKGNKIKGSNFMAGEFENLQFKTYAFEVLSLYNFQYDSILKNQLYSLKLRQMEEEKFLAEFSGVDSIRGFKMTYESQLNVKIRVISNEFTHNLFINNLMLLHEYNKNVSNFELTIN